ncbi:hypothetical protein CYMTET_9694 [Cymbomonas tetramitiformis]|uniref:Uncharacterized protein n=1 Tax=Cymbomonas tetramitiformis TaxID=36881 RepID=A0AAE0GR08_9CHLO|nr:hypothetical protein CYMTET_9694 [Cymbomonas tetramitiformis]
MLVRQDRHDVGSPLLTLQGSAIQVLLLGAFRAAATAARIRGAQDAPTTRDWSDGEQLTSTSLQDALLAAVQRAYELLGSQWLDRRGDDTPERATAIQQHEPPSEARHDDEPLPLTLPESVPQTAAQQAGEPLPPRTTVQRGALATEVRYGKNEAMEYYYLESTSRNGALPAAIRRVNKLLLSRMVEQQDAPATVNRHGGEPLMPPPPQEILLAAIQRVDELLSHRTTAQQDVNPEPV